MAAPQSPRVRAVVSESIPDVLKQLERWVVWRAGALKDKGKFDKVPIDPASGQAVSALEPSNWLSYDRALDAYGKGTGSGIGVVLSADHPLFVAGKPHFLTALDFDQCVGRLAELKSLWAELGQPYVEESPSGKGLRMFGLCRVPFRGGNAGDGREMYSSGRFVTVTGSGAKGLIRDVTEAFGALEREWFGCRNASQIAKPVTPGPPKIPETIDNVRRVLSMLDRISSDMPYEPYRDIVWSIASTGWQCASQIAHKWSRKAAHRYDAQVVDDLLHRYD